jgi:arachidonate 15-lipoxygenase
MAPNQVLTLILTPERWPFLPDSIAMAITRTIAFDTTRLGRVLRRLNPLTPVRNALLPRSALLRSLDWQVRKFFWTVLWCMMVMLQGWPRKAPVPRREKAIRLLSAPETYADFKAPTLVVPDNVPVAEKALPNQFIVQMVHLFQDIYPVVATHQAPAHADPQVRLNRAYTLPYRLIRDAPQWHSDLLAAARSKNLLGALASGGPFAKLLQRGHHNGSEYLIDLSHFSNYEVRDSFCQLGSVLRFEATDGRLVATAIDYEGERIIPDHAKWDFAERIAIAGLNTHVTVWRQGMEYHVGGLASVPVVTNNLLPPAHPMRRLLAPHVNQTLTTNFHTHLTLRRSGFDVTGFTFPWETILRYYDDGAACFDINRLDVEADARRRGIPESLEYPYLPQALRYYGIFGTYFRRYVEHHYSTDSALQSDADVLAWFEALDRTIVRGVRSYVPELSREGLVRLCTLLIYSLSVGHTENSLLNHAVFMPTTVRRDGEQPSVGEIQNILNFQFLITAPSTLLVSDVSHLALDAAAAGIMREYRESLLALQAEMERQPSRHWHLFPSEVEASVSC